MGKQRSSVPRFRRIAEPPAVTLTSDDVTILEQLRRHRFLRSTDLFQLLPDRSPDKLSRRLARLYRAGFVDRPVSQIDRFRGAGSQPLVYGLDNRGEAQLARLDGAEPSKGMIRTRNRAYTRDNLEHTLATADILVSIELACRGSASVEFIPPETLANNHARRWSVSLPWRGQCADVMVAPDAIFGLRVSRGNAPPLRSFYFVEVDTGSMTIAPSERVRRSEAFLYRSSVLRKLLAYAVSHRDDAHQRHLQIPAARVLFLTKNIERANEMRRAARELVLPHLEVPKGLFLFAALPEMAQPFAATFLDAEGTSLTLAPPNAIA